MLCKRTSITSFALFISVILLAACGGGGGGGNSSVNTSPTQVVLASSASDLSKYRGKWQGTCGFTFIVGTTAKSGIGSYEFGTAVSTTVMPGTVSIGLFSSTNCSGTPLTSVTNPFTTTFVSSTATVATSNASTSSVIFSGNADRLSLQEFNRATGAAIGAAQTRYVGFSDNFTAIRVEATSTFSATDQTFAK